MKSLGPVRYDYGFPLRISSAHRQVERVPYAQHVAHMIRQFLLTAPGERVCLPDFGGGLRQLVFAPKTSGLASATELLIRQGLEKYLGQHIRVVTVKVTDSGQYGDGAVEILIEYTLIETQTSEALTLKVR